MISKNYGHILKYKKISLSRYVFSLEKCKNAHRVTYYKLTIENNVNIEELRYFYLKYLPANVKLVIKGNQIATPVLIHISKNEFNTESNFNKELFYKPNVYYLRQENTHEDIFIIPNTHIIQELLICYLYSLEKDLILSKVSIMLYSQFYGNSDLNNYIETLNSRLKIINIDELDNIIYTIIRKRIELAIGNNQSELKSNLIKNSNNSMNLSYNNEMLNFSLFNSEGEHSDYVISSKNGKILLNSKDGKFLVLRKITLNEILMYANKFSLNTDSNVYKYKQIFANKFSNSSISTTFLKTLANNDAYFSKRTDLNDPFDLEVLKRFDPVIYKSLKITDNTCGIFCTAPSWQMETLWSLYGDSFRGACFEYKEGNIFSEILNANNVNFLIYGDVMYNKKRPIYLNNIFSIFLDRYTLKIIRTCFTCFYKFKDWKYEQERRYLVVFKGYENQKINRIINIPYEECFLGTNVPNNICNLLSTLMHPSKLICTTIDDIKNFKIKKV